MIEEPPAVTSSTKKRGEIESTNAGRGAAGSPSREHEKQGEDDGAETDEQMECQRAQRSAPRCNYAEDK